MIKEKEIIGRAHQIAWQKNKFFHFTTEFWFTIFDLVADFYSKSSPLVSKETSLGRNQYPILGEGEVMVS